MLKASTTRLGIAAALSFSVGIVACIYFFRPFPFSKSTPTTVTQECGGFLIDDPQADLLSKAALSNQQKAAILEKMTCYRRQISQEPRYADAYSNLGEAYRRLGDLTAAYQNQQKALQLNPKLQEAKLGLALIEQESGNAPAAIKTIQEVVAQKETATAYFYQGVTLFKQTNFKQAEAAFRKAVELNPNYAEAHVNLGLTLNRQGNYQEAINETRKAIRIKPNLAEAHFNLGVALHAQNQLEGAIAAYREAIRIDPNLAEANYNLGQALKNQGRNNEAIAAYKEVIRINPNYTTAYVNLGANLADQGQLDEAIAQYKKAIGLNPDDAEAYNNLGVALHKQNNLKEAVSMWEEAIRANPNYAEAHRNLGVALATQGKLEEAIATLKQASGLYRAQGKTQKAEEIDQALRGIGVQ